MVVGIDVGGPRKGFHAVALADGDYADRLQTCRIPEMLRWIRRTVGARVVAIDAPCRWRSGKKCRDAEREMLQEGIRCYLTPRRSDAWQNTTGFYQWMFRGMALFRGLARTHPLCRGGEEAGGACAFETFPHAITWSLRGGDADAADKRRQRLAILRENAISTRGLTTMDWIDAALCALSADRFASGRRMHFYGNRSSGHILVPYP